MSDDNNTHTILITGGAGYVGSTVVDHFAKLGNKIRVLDTYLHDKHSLDGIDGDIDVVVGDVRDTNVLGNALDGVDSVIHLAAIVGAPESSRVPEVTWETNLDATKNLVDLMRSKDVRNILFVSTCSNYGKSGKDYVDETATLNPISPYAESKVAAEKFLLSQKSETFNPVICRLATVFGLSPRMRYDLLVNQFAADALKKGHLTILGHQGRTFVHVRDVANVFGIIFERGFENLSGEVFNVGSTKHSNLTKSGLGYLVKEVIPDLELEILEKDLDERDYKVSFDKLKKVLGYDIKYKVKDGIKEIADFLTNNPHIDPYDDIYSNVNSYDRFRK